MKTTLVLLTLVAALLLFAAVVAAGNSATYTLTPEVLASGGGVASSPNYSFISTLGQPLIGSNSSAAYATCGGYWCEIATVYHVYLPVMLKDG